MTNEQTYLSDQDVLNGAPDALWNSGGPAPNDGRIAPQDGNAPSAGAKMQSLVQGLDPSLAFGTSPRIRSG